MGRMIKAEFLKLSKSLGYKVLLLCAGGVGVMVGLFALDTLNPMNGYDIYIETMLNYQVHTVIFSVYSAIFICNEFSNRTFGMSLFSGGSRQSVILSKIAVFLVGILPILFVNALIATAIATAKNGFCTTPVNEILPTLLGTTGLCILGNAAMGSFCVLLAVLVKNIGGTIGAGIGIMLTLDLLAMLQNLQPVFKFSFMYQLKQLQLEPNHILFIGVMTLTLLIGLAASVLVFEKSEFK